MIYVVVEELIPESQQGDHQPTLQQLSHARLYNYDDFGRCSRLNPLNKISGTKISQVL